MNVPQHRTVEWNHEDPPAAQILGGRYDGHSVLWCGPDVTFKDEAYWGYWDDARERYVYMPVSLVRGWLGAT